VTWHLEDYKLGSSPDRQYTALSYYWGDGALSKSFQLNGCEFRVLESAFAIIDAICNNSELWQGDSCCDSWWWIDSICINQNDPRERESQVKLMGRIYSQSQKTIGWLRKGSGIKEQVKKEDPTFTRDGDEAIKSLQKLRSYYSETKRRPSEQREVKIDVSFANWEAIEELFLRPWWKRVWTLQEYLVPDTFHFWCDRSHISRESLNKSIYAIYKLAKMPGQKKRLSAESWRPVWNRRRLCQWYQEKGDSLPLVALISYGSESNATDPKDRIYSVLDLAQGGHDKDLVKPNYKDSCSVSDAYITFFKAFVENHNSLDIICFVEIFNQRGQSSKSVSELPSWVPDWTAEVASCVLPVMASQASNSGIGNFRPRRRMDEHKGLQGYAASGRHSPEHTISEDNKTLECSGTIVDVVQSVAGTSNESCLGAVLSQERASDLLDEISRTLLLDREDRYLNRRVSPGQSYNDFRGLCQAAERHPEDVPDLFFRWFRLNQDLVIQGHSLREICKRSSKRPEFASRYPPTPTGTSTQSQFYSRFVDTTQCMGKMLVTTRDDRIAMAPKRAQKGDKVCVILGCSIPLVLRKKATPNGNHKFCYEVIGECYLDGFMAGEAIQQADAGYLEYEKFRLV
jgi:hypothetical protein